MKDYSLYRDVFNLIPVGVALADPGKRTWVEANDQWCDMLGYPREELEKKKWTELTHPEDLPSTLEQYEKILTGKIDDYEMEQRCIRKGGSVFWANVLTRSIQNPDGPLPYIIVVTRDIEKRKFAEERLRQTEEKYRLLFEQSNDAIILFDHGKITNVNRKACDLLGYHRDQLIGTFALDLHPLEERSRLEEMRKDTEQPPFSLFESQWIKSDGDIIDVEISTNFIKQKGSMLLAIVRDISERKRAEEILQKNERRFRAMIEKSAEVILITNRDRKKTYVSPTVTDVLGYTPEEFLAAEWRNMIHPDDQALFQDAMESIEDQAGETITAFYRCRHKDGAWSWLKNNARNLLQDPAVEAFINNLHDITEMKSSRDNLENERAFLEQLFENPHIAISLVDKNDRYIRINKTFSKMLGFTQEEVIGKQAPLDFIPEESNNDSDFESRIERVKRGERVEYETIRRHKNGTLIPVRISVSPVIVDKELMGVFGIIHDISGLKKAEQHQKDLIKEMEARNEELERFTYTVSHDLKSPLITMRAFLGYIEKAAQSGDRERMKNDIDRITGATQRMEQHLNDLLKLSRIGRIINPPEWSSFQEISQEALNSISGQINNRGVQITIQDEMPLVFGDRIRIREVMVNLIDNAVKFMGDKKDPAIEIGSIEDKQSTVFFIRDNGIGIKPEYHDRIFRLFERLDQNIEGNGIGLTLVKRIIEVHGGHIWVESEGLGHGTTIFFSIPMESEE